MKVVSLSCEIRRGWYLHPMLSTCIRYQKLRSGQPYHEDSEARRSEASQKFDEARRGEARFSESRTRRGEAIWKLFEAKRSDLKTAASANSTLLLSYQKKCDLLINFMTFYLNKSDLMHVVLSTCLQWTFTPS